MITYSVIKTCCCAPPAIYPLQGRTVTMVVKTLCDPRFCKDIYLPPTSINLTGFSVIGEAGSGIGTEWHNGIESVKDILR